MRFNQTKLSFSKTENLAGGEAFQESPELEFALTVLSSFAENQFYRTQSELIKRLRFLMQRISNKKFLAKTAIFARTKFGLRSISHVVAGEIAKHVKAEEWTKKYFEKTVMRPDDMTEILAYYLLNFSKPISNSLKKGLSNAFSKFDEYQLAKYRGNKNSISLADVVNLVHPKPTLKNKHALKKLIKDALRSKNTWEARLTQAGKKAQNEEEKESFKKEAWATLLKEKKIGYFALLKNLRNILETAPEAIDEAIQILTDKNIIKKARILPFRYINALKQFEENNLEGGQKVIMALNQAVEIALSNTPIFDGKTLIVLDSSGSMEEILPRASILAASLYQKNDADYLTFADEAKYLTLNSGDSVLTAARQIEEKGLGGGTNFHAIFEEANRSYNRIIILTDSQGWIGHDVPTKAFSEYKKRTGAAPRVFILDLAGYGTLQFPEKSVYALSGFSEKVFDIMKMIENDQKALFAEIEKIEL